mgnify:CR=1 FL=1
MNSVLDFLAGFFRGISLFFERRKRTDPKMRVQVLLSKDILEASEKKELAALLNKFDSTVVLLNEQSAKEGL